MGVASEHKLRTLRANLTSAVILAANAAKIKRLFPTPIRQEATLDG